MMVLLHGTGGDENDLISLGEAIAPGAALLSPRGKVLENGSPRFFRRLGEGKFDPDEVRRSALDLAEFIRAAVLFYSLDAGRIFALGYSNGANIASALMFLDPSVFHGAILFRPMVVYEPETTLDLAGRFVFIGAGRADTIVPAAHPERLKKLLEERNASVSLQWQPAGHNLAPGDVAEAANWYAVHSKS